MTKLTESRAPEAKESRTDAEQNGGPKQWRRRWVLQLQLQLQLQLRLRFLPAMRCGGNKIASIEIKNEKCIENVFWNCSRKGRRRKKREGEGREGDEQTRRKGEQQQNAATNLALCNETRFMELSQTATLYIHISIHMHK